MAGQPCGAAEGVEVPAQVSFLVCGGNLSQICSCSLYSFVLLSVPTETRLKTKTDETHPHLLTRALLWGFS